jgi:hypothetical protein
MIIRQKVKLIMSIGSGTMEKEINEFLLTLAPFVAISISITPSNVANYLLATILCQEEYREEA